MNVSGMLFLTAEDNLAEELHGLKKTHNLRITESQDKVGKCWVPGLRSWP